MAWVSIYAHDANGAALGGSVEALIRHVEAGAPVRVAYTPDWNGVDGVDPESPPYRRLIMDIDPVLARPGVVFGQAEWRSVDVPPPYEALTFSNASSDYLLNLATTGKVWRRAVRADGQLAEPDRLSDWSMEWHCDL